MHGFFLIQETFQANKCIVFSLVIFKLQSNNQIFIKTHTWCKLIIINHYLCLLFLLLWQQIYANKNFTELGWNSPTNKMEKVIT